MDDDDALRRQVPLLLQVLLEVVQRVAILGEDDYFFGGVLREQLLQKILQVAQLAVLATLDKVLRQRKQVPKRFDFVRKRSAYIP